LQEAILLRADAELRLNQAEVDYLDACDRQQRSERRIRIALVAVAMLLLIGVLVSIGLAIWLNARGLEDKAEHLKDTAAAEKKRADERAQEAKRQKKLREQAENAALGRFPHLSHRTRKSVRNEGCSS
jgi:hypothetical protein